MRQLANAAIDDVRRRVQQETLGHRGHKGDPLYGIRRLLLCSRRRLDDVALGRIDAGLAAGDPYEEVGCVYYGNQLLAAVYAAGDIFTARLELERFFEWAAEVDVPELTRLATTIDRWRAEVLAYFRTGGASSGPVEAVNGELEQVDRPPGASDHSTTTHPDAAQDRRRLADSTHPKTPGPQRSIRARRPRVHRVGPVWDAWGATIAWQRCTETSWCGGRGWQVCVRGADARMVATRLGLRDTD